jgi:hypothetical protein
MSGAPVESHEIRPGLFQMEARRQRIEDLHLLDARVRFLRPRAFVTLEAEFQTST